MKILNKIYSLFAIFILFIIAAFFVLCMKIFPSKQRKIRRIIAKLPRLFVSYKLEIEGKLDEDAQMFILNHQSLLDILLFDELHPKDTSWVAKRELAKVPLLGAGFKSAGCILIDRKNPREIVHILKSAKEKIAQNKAIMIFPEGTRSKGDKLLKFQPGAQIIANKLGLKVQPALIVGSRNIFDSKKLLLHSGVVKIIFLPSFVADGSEFLEPLRTQMQELLSKNLA